MTHIITLWYDTHSNLSHCVWKLCFAGKVKNDILLIANKYDLLKYALIEKKIQNLMSLSFLYFFYQRYINF